MQVLGLLLLLICQLVFASDTVIYPLHSNVSAESLLARMVSASRYHSYQGLLTYEANGSLSTLRLLQRIERHHEGVQVYQQLTFLDGMSRQAVRWQKLDQCMGGRTRWGVWPSQFNISDLRRLYQLQLHGQERVAGRMTYVLGLLPKDHFRYGYRFNIDVETGLMLRAVVLEQGDIVERTQFSTLLLGLAKDEQAPFAGGISWRVPEVLPCHTEQFNSPWAVSWLPDGFHFAGNRMTTQGEQVLIFTDGFVSVSVFILSEQYQGLPKMTARRGATIAVMAPLSFVKGKVVAVVGEIPIASARRMAVSVVNQVEK